MKSCAGLHSTSGAKLCERLLARCIEEEKYLNNDGEEPIPSKSMYTIVLNGWSKSCANNAADRALEILKMMHSSYENKKEMVAKPDTFHYTTVISAFSKS